MSNAKRLALTILVTAWAALLIIGWIALCVLLEVPARVVPAGIFPVGLLLCLPIITYVSLDGKR